MTVLAVQGFGPGALLALWIDFAFDHIKLTIVESIL